MFGAPMQTTVRYGRKQGVYRKTDSIEHLDDSDAIITIEAHIRALSEKIASVKQKAKLPARFATPALIAPQFFEGSPINNLMIGLCLACIVFVVVDVNVYSIRNQNFMLVALSLSSLRARRDAWELELERLRTADHAIRPR